MMVHISVFLKLKLREEEKEIRLIILDTVTHQLFLLNTDLVPLGCNATRLKSLKARKKSHSLRSTLKLFAQQLKKVPSIDLSQSLCRLIPSMVRMASISFPNRKALYGAGSYLSLFKKRPSADI